MRQSEIKRYTEANRAAWNEVMPKHQQASKDKWDKLFSRSGFVRFDSAETKLLRKVGIKGRNVVHLCCNNGVDLMSLKNLGADQCVGFDISDKAIQEASERALRLRMSCKFVRSDVYEIDAAYLNRFDLVYISVGCLGWMPDLELFFKKAAALLKEHGLIFIHEIHPFVDMLPVEDEKEAGSLQIVGSYFRREPYEETGGLDYIGNSKYDSTTTQYWFVHPLSSILMGLISSRINLEHFSEYPTAVSPNHVQFEEAKAGVPLSYILIGRKQAGNWPRPAP